MEPSFEKNQKTARIAAALFLFICIPQSIFSQMYVQSKVFVPQDPAATAANLLSNELLFRASIVLNLLGFTVFVVMTFMFHRILKTVDKHLGLLMITPVIAQLAVSFILEGFNFTALLILKSEPRPDFGIIQQHETAYILMRLYRATLSCDKFLLGLSFIPWGMLIMRSGFVPRILGVLMIISGIGYIADTCAGIILERPLLSTVRPILRSAFLGFMINMIWMLIKGVQYRKAETTGS